MAPVHAHSPELAEDEGEETGEEGEEGEEGKGEEEETGVAPLSKSRDPHLAGGESRSLFSPWNFAAPFV